MGFQADAAGVRADHLDYFGSAQEYRTDPASAWSPTTVIVGEERVQNRRNASGWELVVLRDAMVSAADIASPRINGEIRVGGTAIYTIEARTDTGGGFWALTLRRSGPSEVTRPNYRRRF